MDNTDKFSRPPRRARPARLPRQILSGGAARQTERAGKAALTAVLPESRGAPADACVKYVYF